MVNAQSSPHYVIDMTHYVPFVPENEPPYLVERIKQIHHNKAYKNETWYQYPERFNDTSYYQYTIPGFFDPEGEDVTFHFIGGL